VFRFIPFLIILSTSLILNTGPSMADEQKVYTLHNGMRVVVDEDSRFPLVSLRLYIRAGSSHEPPGQEGISHFLEHMVFKGSEKRAPGEAAREIEEAGGSLNAGTSFDYTVYTVDLPAQKLHLGLDVLQDMVFGASLEANEFKMEKQVVLAEIQRAMDNPGSRLFNMIQSQVWAGKPYVHPILGYPDTVQAMTPEDLRDYMDSLYQPRSMVLSVSGNVETRDVLEKSQELFGNIANRTTMAAPGPLGIPERSEEPLRIMHGPWQKAYMALALPIPDLGSPEATAFDVLAHLLGGDSTSLLYRKFKYEKGMVDEISARALSLDRTGMLYFYIQLSPDELESFWEQFTATLKELDASTFSSDQLERARISLEERIYRTKETLGAKSSRLGFDLLLKNDVRAQDRYLHELRRISRDDLQRLIDGFLCMEKASASILLPEQIPVKQEILHWQQELEPCAREKEEPEVHRVTETLVRDVGKSSKLVILPDEHLPYTALHISWPGSNRLIHKEQQGLPQLAASALTRETKDRSYSQIQEFLKDRAAILGASAGRNSFSLSARFPVNYSSDMYSLIQEVITGPAFSAEEVHRAAANQISSIREQEDRPMGFAFRHLFPFLFDSGPYSYLHLGREEYVQQVSTDEIKDFWQTQRKKPFVLAVSGQVDKKELNQLVRELEQMETGDPAPLPKVSWSGEKVKQVYLKDRVQAHILKVFPVAGKKHEHTAGLEVLNKVLAGQGGLLFRELRDRQGLAYSVTSLLWQTPETGFLALYIGTFEDRTQEALAGFEEIIATLKQTAPDKSEVSRAASLLFGEYHRGRQTLSSRAQEASNLLVQGLDLDFRKEMIDRAGQVEPEQIQALARQYLNTDQSYLFKIIPE